MLDAKLIKELREAPALKNVEIIEAEPDRINLIFEEGTQRTGEELLEVQKILFNFKIFNFIKSEKVELYSNIIKTVTINLY